MEKLGVAKSDLLVELRDELTSKLARQQELIKTGSEANGMVSEIDALRSRIDELEGQEA